MGKTLEALRSKLGLFIPSSRLSPVKEPVAEHITSPEIEEFMPVMHKIVSDLKGAFKKGEYGFLVGEDKSGRIPTLVIREVINHINIIAGRPPIPTVFVKGEVGGQPSNKIHPLKGSTTGGKALIVTERIFSGNSVKKLGERINEAGLRYDIAAISISRYHALVGQAQIYPKSGYMCGQPLIEKNKHLTGLTRFRGDRAAVDPDASRSDVLTAREDVIKAGGQLISRHITPGYLSTEAYKSRIRSLKYLHSRLKS